MRQALLPLAALVLGATAVTAADAPKVDPAAVERAVKATWPKVPQGWEARVDQDETQRLCSIHRNEPPAAELDRVTARERATIVYPGDGKLLGDWKRGERIAQNGRGFQFSDPPGTAAGGNCYACHQITKEEVSFGTLGPSLLAYGKGRDFTPEAVKAAYEKIYNAQALMACSNMPRFGANKVLTVEQITDLVALLMDPASPVNE